MNNNMLKKSLFVVLLAVFILAGSQTFAASTFGRMSENLSVGKILSLSLDSSVKWQVSGINNPSIISASIEDSNLTVSALKPGIATVYACPQNAMSMTDCFYLTVTVSPQNVLGVNTENSNEPHSVGSWVNVNKTVYYVHTNGIIPISTWPIFLNVSAGKNAKIVSANEYDMQLPLLPLMQLNDLRVK